METSNKTQLTKDTVNKQIKVVREFDAPINEVWDAWTKSELLDEWWAPKPWKAETKSMDFREGGIWKYAMVGPDGTKQWCKVDYTTIIPMERFSGNDSFSDEQGNVTNELPSMAWDVRFTPEGNGTLVSIVITFKSEEDLNKILEMGFAEGFTAAHGNLDALLNSQR